MWFGCRNLFLFHGLGWQLFMPHDLRQALWWPMARTTPPASPWRGVEPPSLFKWTLLVPSAFPSQGHHVVLDQDISRLVKTNLKTSTSTALGQSLECKSVCSAELGWTCQCLPPRFLPMIHLVSSCFMSSSKSTSGPFWAHTFLSLVYISPFLQVWSAGGTTKFVLTWMA